jgi:hypothetical protein
VKYTAAVVVGVLATVVLERPVLRLRERFLPAPPRRPEPPPVPATLPGRRNAPPELSRAA